MIEYTHGGWMPPQEPSASCRAMIHSAAASHREPAPQARGGCRLE